MKNFLLLFIAFATISSVSYASFPVSETNDVISIENSETSIDNNIEFLEIENNEVNNAIAPPLELDWSVKIMLLIIIVASLGYLLFVPV
jgi:hypothetical protein